MEDKVFKHQDLPWEHHNHGKEKILIPKDFLGNSSIRMYELAPHEVFSTHEHSYLQIMIFTSDAKGELVLDGERSYDIEKGLVVVVRSNQCHKVTNTSDENMQIFVIDSLTDISTNTPFVDF